MEITVTFAQTVNIDPKEIVAKLIKNETQDRPVITQNGKHYLVYEGGNHRPDTGVELTKEYHEFLTALFLVRDYYNKPVKKYTGKEDIL